MQKKLIDSIQEYFYFLTSKKISKKDVKNKIIPIFEFLNTCNKKMFLIGGSQGIGKTTLIKILEKFFLKFSQKKIITLSLDDFYYDRKKREFLAKSIHPLMKVRGVPGTHDTNEILKIISKFEKSNNIIKLPIFNKIKDKRTKRKRIVKKKSDILIMEGWLCGSPPLKKKFLYKKINNLEKDYDQNYIWRNYYNNKLQNDYYNIFKKFDGIIYLKAPSFSYVSNWRLKQEKKMKKKYNNKIGMNKKEIKNFTKYYEKITKWMMIEMPKKAELIIFVDKNQNIKKITTS